MGKSRRRRSSVVKSITKTASKTIPSVNKGLKTVGSTAKNVASASIPVIEKGVSAVYGTMATGLDLGVKSVKSITKRSSKKSRSKRRSSTGGRRKTKRTHRKH
jgi:hypothetical protein